MGEFFNWVFMIEIPVFIALFKIITKNKKDLEVDLSAVKKEVSDFKLYVARNYVSVSYLKDVENRLTHHLLRIEKKLDTVGRMKIE